MTGEGLRPELSDSPQGAARLAEAPFLTFLGNLGLSWDLRPPPVPLEAAETAVRGSGMGPGLLWAALVGTGGVLLTGLWAGSLFSKQASVIAGPFFPFSMFGADGR